jgi:hypothetical protein
MSHIEAVKALLRLEMQAAKRSGEAISPETASTMLAHIRGTLPDVTDEEILAASRELEWDAQAAAEASRRRVRAAPETSGRAPTSARDPSDPFWKGFKDSMGGPRR